MIKGILFDINAGGQTTLDFDEFAEMLRVPYARNHNCKLFNDFLFAAVKALSI